MIVTVVSYYLRLDDIIRHLIISAPQHRMKKNEAADENPK